MNINKPPIYPRYMYHPDMNEPKRVDSAEQERQFFSKGWVINYLPKEYPKWIDGVLYETKSEAMNAGVIKVELQDIDIPNEGFEEKKRGWNPFFDRAERLGAKRVKK